LASLRDENLPVATDVCGISQSFQTADANSWQAPRFHVSAG
jgi:hypothetical protein